jgi:hypothetical protein
LRAVAAIATRRATIVNGGSPLTATPMKKNDPPQMIDNTTIRAQSPKAMVRLIGSVVSIATL